MKKFIKLFTGYLKLAFIIMMMFGFRYAVFAQTTYVVNSTDDTPDVDLTDNVCADVNGNCTFRAAIQNANKTSDRDIIEFNIAGTAPFVIKPASIYNNIINPIIIDGTSQLGWAVGLPVVVIDGSEVPIRNNGLAFKNNTSNSIIKGLVIGGYRPGADFRNGFAMIIESNNNTIEGNFIGIAPDGETAFPNNRGIQIHNGSDNLIGGLDVAKRNVISGNQGIGIAIFGNEPPEGFAGPNSLNNRIIGNYFGTNVSGTLTVGNQFNIQLSDGAEKTIIEKNIISGATLNGIVLATAQTTETKIIGNFIGTDVTGKIAIPNQRNGILLLQGVNKTIIGGTTSDERNIISGNGSNGISFQFSTASPGTKPVVDNVVLGNYIGLNIDGNALPNQNGIQITGLSENNIIGGSTPNIISGNTSSGIIINGENALNNTIIGNTIGLNAIGNASIPNNTGVFIFNAGGNRIGGNTASERNIISGNSNNGINISDAKGSPNRVLGNYIGTDITGKVAVSNSRGINLAANGGSVIGGSEPGEGNIISGNNFDGIALNSSRDNIILGNQIGLSGSDALPNGQNGILIFSNSTDNVIGGISAGEGNVIAFNISRGVVIIRGPGTVDPERNRVSGNSIFSNAIVGIDLGDFGITPNDEGDADIGPNLLQNFPEIVDDSSVTGDQITINYFVPSSPENSAYPIQVEFFIGDGNRQGKEFLFSENFTAEDFSNGRFKASTFSLPAGTSFQEGDRILATATDANGNTSEFGAEITVTEELEEFELTINTEGSGTVTADPSTGPYTNGTEVTLTASPEVGWTFDRWEGDLTGNTNPAAITMDADKTVTAVFTQNSYTLTVTTTGNGIVAKAPDQAEYLHGTEVTLTATPSSGWVFDRWEGDLTGNTNPATLLMEGNRSVNAVFVEIENILTLNTEGSGTVTADPSQGTYTSGTEVTLTATAATGWTFDRWEGDLTGSTNPATITMDADKTVTAVFTQNRYTLTVTTTGNGTVAKTPDQAEYLHGTEVTLTATPSSGWVFDRWEGDLTGSTNPTLLLMEGNRSVNAVFVEIENILTLNTEGSGTVTADPSQGTYTSGTEVTLTATAATGWTFDRWEGDLTGNTNPAAITMDTDKTVTAVFTQNSYILTVTTTGNGTVAKAPDQAEYLHGTEVTLTATPSSGWVFDRWEGDLTGSTNPATILMEGNRSVNAVFVEIENILTLNTEGSGTVTADPSQGTYTSGTEVTLTATAATGWTFDRWEGDLTGSSNPATITMDADKTVTAVFTQNQYTLTVTTTGNGTVAKAPDQAEYLHGTEVTLTATPSSGWVFDRWEGDLTGSTNPALLLMEGNRSVNAVFVEIENILTLNTEGSGTVTADPSQGTYSSGTEVTLTASPEVGWTFDRWEGDLTGSSNPATITMDADKTVTAVFTQNSYTLTVTTTGNGTVAKAPDQAEYLHGTEVTLTATPSSGWVFDRWEGDLTGSTNPASLLMEGGRSVNAVFVLEDPILNISIEGQGSVSKSPDLENYILGSEVVLTATPSEGWIFIGWSGSVDSNVNPITIVMDSSKTIQALFSRSLEVSFVVNNASCPGSADGKITLTATGGVAPYSFAWDITGSTSTNEQSNLGAGIYTVTVSDASGSTSIVVAEVKDEDIIAPVPDVSQLPAINEEFIVGELPVPTASDNCDGQILGVTTTTFPISVSTRVTWTFTDSSGNSSSQTQEVILNDSEPRVYPNPVDDDGFWIIFPAMSSKTKYQVALYTTAGSLVTEREFDIEVGNNRVFWTIDHVDWSRGTYLLIIKSNRGTEVLKILK